MKLFQSIGFASVLMILLSACQSSKDNTEILSRPEARKDMMNKIANDSSMAYEMMTAMMAGDNSKAMMQDHQKMMMQNHESMMKMLKDNPGMMESMMGSMMDASKTDTAMMSGMCKMMMGNKPMMEMMNKMKGGSMDMNRMQGMDTTKGIKNMPGMKH